MPSGSILLKADIQRTPRIAQLEGLFDLPETHSATCSIEYDIQTPEQWSIGLIVGPSGTGKTQIARNIWPNITIDAHNLEWDRTRAIVDGFPKQMSIKAVCELLSSVGLSSPPSWLKPYGALSNGEQFRVGVARLLSETAEVCVVDEFTSVVDRTVAKITACAVAKHIRRTKGRFVAVSCHYDIAEWMEPDWIYDTQTKKMSVGRSLQRPKIILDIRPCIRETWSLFRKHHYLNTSIMNQGKTFAAWWNNDIVAFYAVVRSIHPRVKNIWRAHRLVVLPDFQGVGIGVRFMNWMGSATRANNMRFTNSSSHPAMVHYMKQSPLWKITHVNLPGRSNEAGKRSCMRTRFAGQHTRLMVSSEYIGPNSTEQDAKVWQEA